MPRVRAAERARVAFYGQCVGRLLWLRRERDEWVERKMGISAFVEDEVMFDVVVLYRCRVTGVELWEMELTLFFDLKITVSSFLFLIIV